MTIKLSNTPVYNGQKKKKCTISLERDMLELLTYPTKRKALPEESQPRHSNCVMSERWLSEEIARCHGLLGRKEERVEYGVLLSNKTNNVCLYSCGWMQLCMQTSWAKAEVAVFVWWHQANVTLTGFSNVGLEEDCARRGNTWELSMLRFYCDPKRDLKNTLKVKAQGHSRVRRKQKLQVETGGATNIFMSKDWCIKNKGLGPPLLW